MLKNIVTELVINTNTVDGWVSGTILLCYIKQQIFHFNSFVSALTIVHISWNTVKLIKKKGKILTKSM